jgi:hypothetical protein
MKKFSMLSILFISIATTAFADVPRALNPSKEKEIRARMEVLQVPFIKNDSQIKDSRVKYYANTFAGTVFVTDDEIVYALRGGNKERGPQSREKAGMQPRVRPEPASPHKTKGWSVKEIFLNAKKTKAVGTKEAETKVSYFKGADPANWRSTLPTYNEVSLGEVYDHIRLNLRAYGENVEKIFIVEKEGNPEKIAIRLEGTKGLKVNKQGELEIESGIGTVKMTRPVAYQEVNGTRIEVAVGYTITASAPYYEYGFKVNAYNRNYPLIIDPLLASTYIGGSDRDYAYALALDSSGNVFVAGYIDSYDYPTTPGAYDTSYNGVGDAFVSKLDNTLTSLLASTYIGGSSVDYAYALALDSSGNVFVAGYTDSYDYPTTPGAYDTSSNGVGDALGDAFVSKLDNTLTSLLASTYIGGSNYYDWAYALALDSSGNVFVAGWTTSSDYPTTPGAYDTSYNGVSDGFVSKLNNTLTSLLASTYIGGSDVDWASALALDSSGNVFVAGHTDSYDYPTTPGAYDTSYNGVIDVFVSKLNNTLTSLLASTYIGGGSDVDYAYALALDSSGNVFVAGFTYSYDYPTTPGAYDTSFNGTIDAFVSKLDNDLSQEEAPCPVTLVLNKEPENISLIRKLRDTVLLNFPEGKQYVQMFYDNSAEVVEIIKRNPAIRERIYDLLTSALPDMVSLLLGNKVTISREVVEEIGLLCDAFSREASPALKGDINRVKADLRSGKLFKEFGIRLKK